MFKPSRHSKMTWEISAKSSSDARSSFATFNTSFFPISAEARSFPQDETIFSICFGGNPKSREMKTLLPCRTWRTSSHDLSKLRSLSFSYFEMSCLPLIGSKVVACELLDTTEAGEDGRDGGCAMGWTKSLAKAYNQGSFGRAGANGARR
jgi:hypothetical protein